MTWGKWGKQLNKKEMIALMNHCLENHITTFDHADIYGGYTNEADFGEAFKASGIVREEIEIISKCGIQYICDNRENKVKHYNYSKDYIIWSVEKSLKDLQTDYLDLLLLHRPSPLMEPQEIATAVMILKAQGKIKHFGVSNFTDSQMDLIASKIPIEVNQIEYSLTQNKAMYDGTIDYMTVNSVLPMVWSPLGSLFKEDNEQTRRIQKQLGELMDKYNASEDQLLLAWLLKHPSRIHPVIGTTDLTRITKSVEATQIDLDIEDWFLMLLASQGHKVP